MDPPPWGHRSEAFALEYEMGTESWVEDESHCTINGVRWVARKCIGCSGDDAPCCEFKSMGYRCERPKEIASCVMSGGTVRWYHADSPALAFFDKPMEEPKPVTDHVRPLSEICMDGIRSSLKTFFQDRDRRAVEALRDSRAANLDARVQAAMDAMLTVPDSFAEPTSEPKPAFAPAPAPEDDVEIIIDPTPEQVPKDGLWGCWWNDNRRSSGCEKIFRSEIRNLTWNHYAVLVRGHLTPTELVARVRQMLAEKEGK